MIVEVSLVIATYLQLARAAEAPGVLRGAVLDPNGRSVPRVRVEIQPGSLVVHTDEQGQFRLSSLAAGVYTISATHPDFEAAAGAAPVSPGAEAQTVLRFPRLRAGHMQVDVIGGEPEAALREIPGSASLVTSQELAAQQAADANEVLRGLPGVHIREDSGPAGMRLNIGIRGLNPDRSRTLLVLEDGLPVALAPYGEPEMYYSPPIDRMCRLEVLKGSGSIVHGPQTIGGVLNFITPDPPSRPQGTLQLTGGQRAYFSGQASYGGTKRNRGWHLNVLRKQSDGWRGLYYDINDALAKLNLVLSDYQRLGLKFGFYDEKSNSTYLGLTESQFRANPGFNSVPDDLLKVRRYSGSLFHQVILSPRALLSNSLFGYTTTRNWRRQDFDRTRRPGVSYRSVVGDEIYLRDTSGNNNRSFDVVGADSRLSLEHRLLGWNQRLETGLRYLYEEHRDRRVDGSHYLALSGELREDERRHGRAVSGYLQNRMLLSRQVTLTPGLRLERYRYVRHILRQPVGGVPADVSIRNGDGVFKAIPGAGVAVQLASPLTVFAGAHRGFAPPRVKDAITRAGVSLQLEAELSWNYEVGARLALSRPLRAEATLFAIDFENQIIPAAQSGGATTTLINGGETLHRGAEFLLAADWARVAGPRFGLWTEVRYTWLPTARFTGGIYRGNRLPYAPESTLALRAGYRHQRGFSFQLDGTRVSDQFGDNRATIKASADGTVGLLPAYWVWNLAAGYELQRERWTVSPFVTVKNLANAFYISSRAPLGIQPGMFRQVNLGVKLRF